MCPIDLFTTFSPLNSPLIRIILIHTGLIKHQKRKFIGTLCCGIYIPGWSIKTI